MIDRCRSPPTFQATDTETAVVWEVPQFSDNSGMGSQSAPLRSARSTGLRQLMFKQGLFHCVTGKRRVRAKWQQCETAVERMVGNRRQRWCGALDRVLISSPYH